LIAITASIAVSLVIVGLALLLPKQEKPARAYRVIEPDRVVRRRRKTSL
jgi:hypothetical protein